MNIGQRILWCNSCHFDISMLAQLNDCIGGLLHLGPNVITSRTLLHLGQLLHLGLQQTYVMFIQHAPFSVAEINMLDLQHSTD